jgi:hypothetical protein
MFYTPKHCCECGEKIERDEWKLLTSRRFCETCESEFKGQDWLLRVVIGLGILGAIFGIGSFLKKSDKPLNVTTTPIAQPASNKSQNVQNSQVLLNEGVQTSLQKQSANNAVAQSNAQTPEMALSQKPLQTKQGLLEKQQNSESETVYFCGAQTKKGTPCTRRVKGNGRCWQHTGQPAMLPPEKLIASR